MVSSVSPPASLFERNCCNSEHLCLHCNGSNELSSLYQHDDRVEETEEDVGREEKKRVIEQEAKTGTMSDWLLVIGKSFAKQKAARQTPSLTSSK